MIRRIRRIFPAPDSRVQVPIGDDAAVLALPPSQRLVVTTDQLVEGVHFHRGTHPPALLGEKALAVNLSDLAAMGCTPRWALLSLLLPFDLPPRYLEQILRGMARSARRYGVSLIGGNLSSSKMLALDVTLLGTMEPGVRPLRRSGARPGDMIYVSGSLGGAALGLSLLSAGWRMNQSGPAARRLRDSLGRLAQGALRAHLAPVPELELGSLLARHALATAAMDLSDGLSLDLHRLCRASRVGARIFSSALPLDPAALKWVGEEQALELALRGGEDYRLLFAVPRSRTRRLCRLVPLGRLHPIGQMVRRSRGITLEDDQGHSRTLSPIGFDHLIAGNLSNRRVPH